MAVALNSSVNLQVLPGRSIATVVDGTVTLLRPVSRVLTRGQQVEALRGGVLRGLLTLSDAQLRAVYAWVAKYQQIK